ncbi:hypothetical protein BV898_16756 [Hypsibius exemplaris]|uniref:Uncharacterized protein n=1 Tax=Hypsibius exemplaris TaxID=2072580 RepID=A0A9X6NGI0_HYPEX|nr:hypothetical protein BV898_16756 [Hypsibius exemplaris]
MRKKAFNESRRNKPENLRRDGRRSLDELPRIRRSVYTGTFRNSLVRQEASSPSRQCGGVVVQRSVFQRIQHLPGFSKVCVARSRLLVSFVFTTDPAAPTGATVRGAMYLTREAESGSPAVRCISSRGLRNFYTFSPRTSRYRLPNRKRLQHMGADNFVRF